MTRVSDTSTHAAIKFAINKSKKRLEDLQLKGSTLKNITRPSDNPVSSVESLTISSILMDNKQYIKNSDSALLQLNTTEKAIEQITDLLVKAKEIAIAQASDFYGADIRKNVANEIHQLRNQALAIANQRIGQKYLFAGYKSLTRPFDKHGVYRGDTGQVTIEVAKDFFVPTNLNGAEVFFSSAHSSNKIDHPLEKFPELKNSAPKKNIDRNLASIDTDSNKEVGFQKQNNIFAQLAKLAAALENNDSTLTQNLLEGFDDSISRLITMRTRIGSFANSIHQSKRRIELDEIDFADRNSKLIDSDVAELFSDITRQQDILKTTYQATKALINLKLLDFLR